METRDTQILIVGAGPTGLALAQMCLQQGLQVRILDKKPGPSTTSKAVGLQYRVSEVLACMGVVDRFLQRGGNPTLVNMYVKQQPILQLEFRGFGATTGRDAFAPALIMLPQSETENLLWDAVREHGGDVEWKTEFLDFTQDADRVVSRIRRADGREETIVSDFLVSCEGAHSVIRKQAGLSFAGKTYPLAFFMADVEMDWDRDPGATHVWFHADGSCAAMPFPQLRRWRLFFEMPGDAEPRPEGLTLDEIRRLAAERMGDPRTTISNPTWISEFRIHCRMVDRYRQGRVFVAGDAAHIHSPTGGQGIATGIQDAANLAWKLGRVLRGAPSLLLDTYEQERLPKAQEVLSETNRLTTLLFAPNRAVRLLRDYLVLPVLRARWTQRKMLAKLAQLHVSYRESSLSVQQTGWRRCRIRAGDRAPDVAFRRAATGDAVTLIELLQGMQPVAFFAAGPHNDDSPRHARVLEMLERFDIDAYQVAPPGDECDSGDSRRLVDVHGDFQRLYGMASEFLCVIRPDDHVGLVQSPIDERRLHAYLQQISADSASAVHPAHDFRQAAGARL